MLNNKFLITWSRDGKIRTLIKEGISELSEFIRNSDVYDRKIIKVEAV